MEPDDPPPKAYGFKVREFKRDNARIPDAPPVPTARDHAVMAGPHVPTSRKPAAAKPDDPNDVHAVLRHNRAVEKKFGLDEIEIKQVKSRRQRDFWLMLVGGNLAIIGAVVVTNINVVTVIFGLSGLIIFSLGLSWVMWQVMDKY